MPVRRVMPREREQEPRCWTFQSQTERRDRGQTEKSWLLFEGVDTFLYDLMRKSKIENLQVLARLLSRRQRCLCSPSQQPLFRRFYGCPGRPGLSLLPPQCLISSPLDSKALSSVRIGPYDHEQLSLEG